MAHADMAEAIEHALMRKDAICKSKFVACFVESLHRMPLGRNGEVALSASPRDSFNLIKDALAKRAGGRGEPIHPGRFAIRQGFVLAEGMLALKITAQGPAARGESGGDQRTGEVQS
jgi:hypothetical protein